MLSTVTKNGGGGGRMHGLGGKVQELCFMRVELDLTARHPLGDAGKTDQDFSLDRSESCSREVRSASCHYGNSR